MVHDSLLPARIYPEAVYHDGQARLLLGVTGATMARARREGRLRYTRQGNRVLYLGSWLLDWLESDADREAADTEGHHDG
jgi:hypothetical protein